MSNDNVPPRDKQGSNPVPHTGSESEGHGGKPQGDRSRRLPAAGPHADPSLVNPDLTPGTGSLPSSKQGGDADPGTD